MSSWALTNTGVLEVRQGTMSLPQSYTPTAASTVLIPIGGLSPGTQFGRLLMPGQATLNGTLLITFTDGFVPAEGDYFNVLNYGSRTGAFATNNLSPLGLTEYYGPNKFYVVAGDNAFPTVAFTVSGGNTQSVCIPFTLKTAVVEADGTLTNISILKDGLPFLTSTTPVFESVVEIDFPGTNQFIARASDNEGAWRFVTQDVAVVACELHALLPAGFRPDAGFKLCMVGETNRDYEVFAKDEIDTTNWSAIGVMESTNGIWRIFDPAATNYSYRFYRAKQLP